jgi:hypothetical protein
LTCETLMFLINDATNVNMAASVWSRNPG